MIVGISGRISSGKDSLGMIIQALTSSDAWAVKPLEYITAYQGRPNLKGGWKIVKFADKLKEIASMLTGIPREDFEKQEVKDSFLGSEWDSLPGAKGWDDVVHKMTVREFLQKLGTEGLRNNLHGNVWVNALFADYKAPESSRYDIKGLPNWIITDVRFPNEAQAIKDKGGIVVRIDRPDNPTSPSNHSSEVALDNWDFDMNIVNESLEGLVETAKLILEQSGFYNK